MGILTEWITEWLKGLLIEGIMGNLTGLFDTVNGNVTIPFIDRFPRGEIYDLLTTRPEDMAHERKGE